jgi:hypothetical protein
MGFAFSRLKVGCGLRVKLIVDSLSCGGRLESEEVYERADYYTIGFGIDYFLRFGAGLTHKRVYTIGTDIIGSTSVYDYGIMIELPVMDLLFVDNADRKKIRLHIIPSLAYARANVGGTKKSIDAQPPPLPKIEQTCAAIDTYIDYKKSQIISYRRVGSSRGFGNEIGFGGFFFYRWGHVNLSGSYQDQQTRGYGFHLKGLLSWLEKIGLHYPEGFIGYIIHNIDFSYDYCYYPDNGFEIFSDVKFHQFSISL